jgi:hypothetical protein
VLDEEIGGLKEVREAQLVDPERRLEPQLAEERRPVVGLEGLAAYVLEARRDVLDAG